MGWSGSEVVCRKHQNHRQSPGVCSCCLREKLSVPINLVLPSFNQYSSPSNSSSPTKFYYYSSGHSSTHMSPSSSRRGGKHHRIKSDVLSSFSFVSGSSGGDGLKKSRSIAFVAARGRRGGGGVKDGVTNNGNIKEKKEGFWSKLMKSTSKRTKDVFEHPRIKESFVN